MSKTHIAAAIRERGKMTTNAELLQAAIAIIERWDSPLWKDLPATAEYIMRLRKAVDNAKVFHTKPSTDDKDMSATDFSQVDGVGVIKFTKNIPATFHRQPFILSKGN